MGAGVSELRIALATEAKDLGHRMSDWKEYKSQPGKWTSHCHRCGGMLIVYDALPSYGDQINGPRIIEQECRGEKVS